MSKGMLWLLVPLLGLLSGCDKLDAALPALSLQARAPEEETVAMTPAVKTPLRARDAQQRLGRRLAELRQRLTLPAHPKSLPDCQGNQPRMAPDAGLMTAFVDSREQMKSLIPRRVAERLESEDRSELLHAAELLEGRTPEELAALEGQVDAWQERRYLGVFYVTEYSGPALVVRVGELKRSWVKGAMAADFALYDTVEQRLLCAYALRVENDTRDSPIRSRLQSDTRIRLERELASSLLAAAQERLGQSGQKSALATP